MNFIQKVFSRHDEPLEPPSAKESTAPVSFPETDAIRSQPIVNETLDTPITSAPEVKRSEPKGLTLVKPNTQDMSDHSIQDLQKIDIEQLIHHNASNEFLKSYSVADEDSPRELEDVESLSEGLSHEVPILDQAVFIDQPVSIHQQLTQNYELLRKKNNIHEIQDLVHNLEDVAAVIENVKHSRQANDDFKESWQPVIQTIEDFAAKKQVLSDIELKLKQTIAEMRDIHIKMIESLELVKNYEAERQANYAARHKLASELKDKIAQLKIVQ
jgi:hypothetical protein